MSDELRTKLSDQINAIVYAHSEPPCISPRELADILTDIFMSAEVTKLIIDEAEARGERLAE